jgi:radical SAM protein with 4Fe4S-binding SPASM domain
VVVTWDLGSCGTSACLVCDQEAGAGGAWAARSMCDRIVTELSRFGTLVVSLVGGRDPCLHPKLPAIVADLARAHFPVLTSYGYGLTAQRARQIWDAGLVEAAVVLNSADAAAHDVEIGWPGAHARALKALKVLLDTRQHARQRVNASVTLGPDGASAVEAVIELVRDMGAGVIVEPPSRSDAKGTPRGLGARLLHLRRQSGALRNSAGYLAKVDQALADGVSGCKAGQRSLHVDQRGRVFRCSGLAGPSNVIGDLVSENAQTVLARLRRHAAIDGCTECWRPVRGEVECLGSWRGLWTLSNWLWS